MGKKTEDVGKQMAEARDGIARLDAALEDLLKGLAASGFKSKRLALAVEELKGRRADLARELLSCEAAAEGIGADEEAREKEAFERLRARAIQEAQEKARAVAEAQREAAAKAKELAALVEVVRGKVPDELLYRRTDRFVRCELPPGPAADLHKAADGRGVIHVELLRALDGERRGVWRIEPGQDLTVDPEAVEEVFRPGALPDELDRLTHIDLGATISLNGTVPERTTYHDLVAALTDQDLAEAARRLGLGGRA